MKRLAAYDFPGNVRELEAEVERAVVLADPGGTITLALSRRSSGAATVGDSPPRSRGGAR